MGRPMPSAQSASPITVLASVLPCVCRPVLYAGGFYQVMYTFGGGNDTNCSISARDITAHGNTAGRDSGSRACSAAFAHTKVSTPACPTVSQSVCMVFLRPSPGINGGGFFQQIGAGNVGLGNGGVLRSNVSATGITAYNNRGWRLCLQLPHRS